MSSATGSLGLARATGSIAPADAPSVGVGVPQADDPVPSTPSDDAQQTTLGPNDPIDLDPLRSEQPHGKRSYRVLIKRDGTLTWELLAAVKNIKAEKLQAQLDAALAALGRANHTPPAPAGATPWISPADVMRLHQCSKSLANQYVRAAAGRTVGTGELLRVPLDVWEAWARENLIDVNGKTRRRTRWESAAPRTRSTSTCEGRSGGAGTTTQKASSGGDRPAAPTRRRRGPFSPPGSELPLIPHLKFRKP
jgi:hypothetical protein